MMRSILTTPPAIRVRSDGIDALRGAFALWVLFAHLVPWAVAVQGSGAVPAWLVSLMEFLGRFFQPAGELHPAVLAFIVLSGYCIHRAGFRATPDSLQKYAVRRSFRILPIYAVATVIGIAGFGLATETNAELGAMLSGTIKIDAVCVLAKLSGAAALVPTFHPCSFIGNAPLATVMVEIWLYIVYAVLFAVFVWRGRERMVWAICGAVFVIGLFVAAFASRWPMFYNWWQNSSLLGFLPYWWLGTIFLQPAVAKRSRLIAAVSLAAWIALTIPQASAFLSELRKLAFGGIVGAVIVWAETIRSSAVRPFSTVGQAGYSLYAFHAPITYVLVIWGVQWWAIVLANLIAASIGYALIERPLTLLGKSITGQRLTQQAA